MILWGSNSTSAPLRLMIFMCYTPSMIKIVIKISDKFIVTRYSSGVNDDLLYIVVYMRENMQEFLVIYTFFLEITESLWYDARA